MFGIAKDIRSEVRECTPDLLNQALDSPQVAKVCAEIEDALEKCRRGEITKEEYETMKANLKKRLPILTFHATFKNGRRKNDDAVPSGLSIYDLDHIENPRAKWDSMKERSKELGIVLAHISPSLEGYVEQLEETWIHRTLWRGNGIEGYRPTTLYQDTGLSEGVSAERG